MICQASARIDVTLAESVTDGAFPCSPRAYSEFAMNNNWRVRRAGLLLTLSCAMAQAGEDVKWSDLPQRIGHGKMRSDGREDRQYRVITKTGQTYNGNQLTFWPESVVVGSNPAAIPREQVAEIRIRRDKRLTDALMAPASAIVCGISGPCDGEWIFHPLEMLTAITIGPVVWVATAPVVLPIEGIRRLLPDKVFKVAP